MKVAVSVGSPTLDAEIDPRFGRCRYFVIIDVDDMKFETLDNAGAMAGGGAGIATAQAIAAEGVDAVITGSCGPNAYQVLAAAGIKVVTGASGMVRQVLEDYNAGKLSAVSEPNVPGHYGMGRGMGRGRSRGRR
jgi:predicted Fe-Mo cluster-binding NifX family protein